MEIAFTKLRKRQAEVETYYSRKWNAHPLVLAAKKGDVEFLILEMWKYRSELHQIQVEGKQFWKMVLETGDERVLREFIRNCEGVENILPRMREYVRKLAERRPFLDHKPLLSKLSEGH